MQRSWREVCGWEQRPELASEEELCYLILVSGGSCNVQWDGQTTLAGPGCALLLGPGSGRRAGGQCAAGALGCHFPVAVLHDIRNTAQRDDSALFEPGKATLLYGPVQWSSCLRTVLELMRKARGEQDYPGILSWGSCSTMQSRSTGPRATPPAPATRQWSRSAPTLPPITSRSFPSARWRQSFTSRPFTSAACFRRVTGQSIVDYINGRRIEAARSFWRRRSSHRHGGGADGLCQRRPFPACLPGDHGHRAAAIPEEPSMRQTALPSPSSLTTGSLRGLPSERRTPPVPSYGQWRGGVCGFSRLGRGRKTLSP